MKIYKYNNMIFDSLFVLFQLTQYTNHLKQEEIPQYKNLDNAKIILEMLISRNAIEYVDKNNLKQELETIAESQLKELILILKWKRLDLRELEQELDLLQKLHANKEVGYYVYKNIAVEIISESGIITNIIVRNIVNEKGNRFEEDN